MNMNGPLEIGGEEVARRPLPSMGCRQEVTGEGEVKELAVVRSVRSLQGRADPVGMVGPLGKEG